MFFYNSLTRKKEKFAKRPNETVKIYTSGTEITHLGHLLGPVVFDTLKRYLTHLGYPVKWVYGTKQEPSESHKLFLDHLGVTGIDVMPCAAAYAPQAVKLVRDLIQYGHAFYVHGIILFDASQFGDYGKLNNPDKEKMPQEDFLLLNKGIPETCAAEAALIEEALGAADIHSGGRDLRPHHDKMFAQNECLRRHAPVKVWMHHGVLRLGRHKMSDDNCVKIPDVINKFPADAIRLFFLSAHYRSNFDIGIIKDQIPSALVTTNAAYQSIFRIVRRIEKITLKLYEHTEKITFKADFADIHHRFCECLDDDFDTPRAVTVMFELANKLHRIADKNKLETNTPESDKDFKQGASLMKFMTDMFGLTMKPFAPKIDPATELIKLLVSVRDNMKHEAKVLPPHSSFKAIFYRNGDLIRTKLKDLGITLEDTDKETKWSRECK